MMQFLPIVFVAACASGRANPPASQPPSPAAQDSARPRAQTGVQPYARTIEGTTAKDGIFRVHSGGDKVLYEIPRAQLGRPFLWVTQMSIPTVRRCGGSPRSGRPSPPRVPC
jgi:hypothetical protein